MFISVQFQPNLSSHSCSLVNDLMLISYFVCVFCAGIRCLARCSQIEMVDTNRWTIRQQPAPHNSKIINHFQLQNQVFSF